jgi:hypothetical protein
MLINAPAGGERKNILSENLRPEFSHSLGRERTISIQKVSTVSTHETDLAD